LENGGGSYESIKIKPEFSLFNLLIANPQTLPSKPFEDFNFLKPLNDYSKFKTTEYQLKY